MSGRSIGQSDPARSSFSSPSSPASSSTRHSTSSPVARDFHHRGQESSQMNTGSPREDEPIGQSREWDQEDRPRSSGVRGNRHHAQSSGGFLLDNSFSLSRGFRQRQHDGKGKRRRDTIPDRASDQASSGSRHRQTESSPLAHEVTKGRSVPPEQGSEDDFRDIDDASSRPSSSSYEPNTGVLRDGEYGQRPRQSIESRSSATAAAPAQVLDTDPAQIVNLALNLSQSRRNVSGGRLAPVNAINHRRISSAGQAPPPAALQNGFYGGGGGGGSGGGSLREHLNQQRRISRNLSPTTRNFSGPPVGSPHLVSQQPENLPWQSPSSYDQNQAYEYAFSPSTLSRSEKAQRMFDLAAEYRRLLQYLPPLKPGAPSTSEGIPKLPNSPDGSEPQRPASRVNSATTDTPELGRHYNPLQCIRNRKVRARERQTIDYEAGGFTDLGKVKEWVGRIEDEAARPTFSGHAHVPLLPFDSMKEAEESGQSSSAAGGHRRGGSVQTKPKRPRMDWFIHPAEFIADALWLEQGDNRALIEDREGNKLYPQEGRLSSPRTSRRTPFRPSSPEENFVSGPEIPYKVPPSAGQKRRGGKSGDGRGRRRQRSRESATSFSDNGGRQRRRKWLSDRSRTRSSSSSSSDEGSVSSRIKTRRPNTAGHQDMECVALEKQMMEMLEKETKEDDLEHGKGSVPPDGRDIGDVKLSDGRQSFEANRGSLDRGGDNRGSATGSDRDISNRGDEKRPIPSIEVESLSESSPQVSSPLNGKLWRRGSSGLVESKEMDAISENDFAMEDEDAYASRQPSPEAAMQRQSSMENEEPPSPTKKFAPRVGRGRHRYSKSFDSTRRDSNEAEKDPVSRVRGMFKGTKLEAIKNEVSSKVGDLLWKKDGTASSRPPSSRAASSFAGDTTDSEAEPSGLETSKRHKPEAYAIEEEGDENGQESRATAHGNEPKYHLSNLPTFQSQEAGQSPSDMDQISRQNTPLGRSPLSEKLAPPRIDVQDVSASSSELDLSRTQTRDTEGSYLDPQGTSYLSGYRSDGESPDPPAGVHSADQRLNSVLGLPGTIGARRLPVTGLAHLGVTRSRSPTGRPTLEGKRQWSITDKPVPVVKPPATRQEVGRVAALLLSSGIKARQINRRADEIRTPGPEYLQDILKGPNQSVVRSQEAMFAARAISNEIQVITSQFEFTAQKFSNTTVNGLLDQINGISDRISTELTSHARSSADDADTFVYELTTTHTLAIKRINDSLDSMLRRRRRRIRWMRRAGYVLLEWALLGIMWWVWLIVVLVRFVRGTVCGVVRAVKWVLWL
ncbi:MAG: hypothetical protein M1819_005196 [Sarea resinae]|nr:MAG: hypothetical protein M1819_005196 [Sarea resinae]